MKSIIVSIILAATNFTANTTLSAVIGYQITDIGLTDRDVYINNEGVATFVYNGYYGGGVTWEKGNMNYVGNSANGLTPYDISNNKTVAGSQGGGAYVSVAGVQRELQSPDPTFTSTGVRGVNNSGVAVGNFGNSFQGGFGLFVGKSCAWNLNQNSVVCTAIPLGSVGHAYSVSGINDNNIMVGMEYYQGANRAITLRLDGSVNDLGVSDFSRAIAINNLGDIVGFASRGLQDQAHYGGFLWQNGVITDLGAPSDHSDFIPYSINDDGSIVGTASQEAYIWKNGVFTNLNDSIPTDSGFLLKRATDINSSGQIVGYGLGSDNLGHAFLLNPIPEPSTLILLLASFTATSFVRRRY